MDIWMACEEAYKKGYAKGYEDCKRYTVLKNEESLMNDIKFLIENWFSALEDEGAEPWEEEDCVRMANKYQYTKEDYKKFLNMIY